ISGAPQYPGILDVDPTFAIAGFPKNAPNLGTQMEAAGIKWRSYQESMGTPCKLSGSGSYAAKHDPFLYFTDMQASPLCGQRNADSGHPEADHPADPNRYYFITPNLTDDGHDPSTTATDIVNALKTSDSWAQTEIGKIMATPAYKNGGVIFVTWDEAEARNG